jgi:hypothetical protein
MARGKAVTGFKPGDRVIDKSFGTRAGHIVKPARTSATVKFDGKEEPERVYLNSLRPETVEDVAKRVRGERMRQWRDEQPRLSVVTVSRSWGGDEEGVSMHARTPDEMRRAADELRMLADWFDAKPQFDATQPPAKETR